jgi:CHRD domain
MTRAGLARLSAAFVASVCLSGLVASAQVTGKFFTALVPEQEVPAVSSEAVGTLTLDIDEDGQEIAYELTYSGLSSTVAQAHIHFAQPGVNGSIILWLCEGTSLSPFDSTPACPQSGTVTGKLTPAEVLASSMTGQQILAGEFDEAVAFIRKGLAYANVHTANSGGGEIRGQIRPGAGPK